jgi:hypothetical protein
LWEFVPSVVNLQEIGEVTVAATPTVTICGVWVAPTLNFAENLARTVFDGPASVSS